MNSTVLSPWHAGSVDGEEGPCESRSEPVPAPMILPHPPLSPPSTPLALYALSLADVGGYVTHYANNFSFATVRGAGHMCVHSLAPALSRASLATYPLCPKLALYFLQGARDPRRGRVLHVLRLHRGQEGRGLLERRCLLVVVSSRRTNMHTNRPILPPMHAHAPPPPAPFTAAPSATPWPLALHQRRRLPLAATACSGPSSAATARSAPCAPAPAPPAPPAPRRGS